MLGRDAFVAEVAVDLVDAVHAADHQALEVELGRDAQEEVHVERVMVRGERLGHSSAGDGMHHRGFDFDEGIGVEEASHRLHNFRALDEDLAHVGVHGEIDIAAAIAGLDVLQAVPFFRQREQVLNQKRDLFDVNGQFARAGAEQVALHADVVTQVEQLVERKAFFAHEVELDVNLQLLAALLEVGESGLALQADGHDASGHTDVDPRVFEFFGGLGQVGVENLREGVGGFVAVGVGELPQRFNLLQLFFAKFVDFLVEGQSGFLIVRVNLQL